MGRTQRPDQILHTLQIRSLLVDRASNCIGPYSVGTMLDTHCHLSFPQFRDNLQKLLSDARAHGVAGAITISTTTSDALQSLDIAQRFANVWCSAGIHPLNCDEPIHWPDLLTAASDPKCVAWGELGLDHHYDDPPRPLQIKVLEDQLTFIKQSGIELPVVVHCRKAFSTLIPILRSSGLPADRFVFHCFTGDEEEARQVLEFGAWISLTGIATFKSAKDVQAAAKLIPDDRIMIETDAPFCTPEPFRKIRPNTPRYAIETARFVANLRASAWDDFHHLININTERFFGIPQAQCVVEG